MSVYVPITRQVLTDTVSKLCAPPGSGWATSKAGYAPLAANFHTSTFGSTDPVDIRGKWLASLVDRALPEVGLIGVPYDAGTYGLNGTAAGPLGVRTALGKNKCDETRTAFVDLGDVPYFPGVPLDEMLAPAVASAAKAARYGNPASDQPICMLSVHQALIRAATAAGVRMVSIGGDHSIAASALLGLYRPGVGLVHIDSHPDLSTGRDGLGLLHSSWIHYVDERLDIPIVLQIGVRESPIAPWIEGKLKRIDDLADPVQASRAATEWLIEAGVHEIYLSVDIDAVDALQAPATPLPASSGLALSNIISFIRELAKVTRLVGADLVEVAPLLSCEQKWEEEITCITGSMVVKTLLAAFTSSGA